MTKSTLSDFTLIKQFDFVDFYESPCKEIHIASFKESFTIDEEMAKESLGFILNYKQNKPTFGVTDASAISVDFTKEARNYFRKHMNTTDTALHAIVVADTATRILANIYARFERPKVPTRVFNNLNDALEWLEDMKT